MINWGDSRLPERFWRRCIPEPMSGCWFWTGSSTVPRGNYGAYGKYSIKGRPVGAHRAAWTALIGPIGDGLQIDHLCRNAYCVNPAHLEPVTPRVNMQRSSAVQGLREYKAAQKHCKHGHEWTPDNTVFKKNGARSCLACRVENSRKRTVMLRDTERALKTYSPRPRKFQHRTHCKRGHEMSGDNLILKPTTRHDRPNKEQVARICKACKVEQARKDYERAVADGRRVIKTQRKTVSAG